MTHVSRLTQPIVLHQLGFRFANGVPLFESLQQVFDATPTAIVGRNGVGKSILARLIAGELVPSSGRIERQGRVAFVAQETCALPSMTLRQATGLAPVLEALARLKAGTGSVEDLERVGDRWDLEERVQTALTRAGLPSLDDARSERRMSGGQCARIALTGALLSGAEWLILDEPTNHLDRAGRAWLSAELSAWRGGLIVISHDRQLLSEVERIVELTPNGLRSYGGNYAVFCAQREREQGAARNVLEHARAERARERRRLEKEHDTIQRRAAVARRNAETLNAPTFVKSGKKQAATEIMGTVRKNQSALKSELDAKVSAAAARVTMEDRLLLSLPCATVAPRKQVLRLENVRLPWGMTQDPAARVNWSLEGPVRVALTGVNGCGKSTLLRILAGDLQASEGLCAVHVPSAYLDQRLESLDPARSIIELLQRQGTLLTESKLRGYLALLQLDAQRATRPTRDLSGGERLKAALACALWREMPAQLLLLDEPSNHLDLESTLAVESALSHYPGAIIAASHDDDFLCALKPTHCMQWTPDGWRFEALSSEAQAI